MPLSDHNGDSSFTIGGKTYTNQSSSGTPVYKITSGGGSGTTVNAGAAAEVWRVNGTIMGPPIVVDDAVFYVVYGSGTTGYNLVQANLDGEIEYIHQPNMGNASGDSAGWTGETYLGWAAGYPKGYIDHIETDLNGGNIVNLYWAHHGGRVALQQYNRTTRVSSWSHYMNGNGSGALNTSNGWTIAAKAGHQFFTVMSQPSGGNSNTHACKLFHINRDSSTLNQTGVSGYFPELVNFLRDPINGPLKHCTTTRPNSTHMMCIGVNHKTGRVYFHLGGYTEALVVTQLSNPNGTDNYKWHRGFGSLGGSHRTTAGQSNSGTYHLDFVKSFAFPSLQGISQNGASKETRVIFDVDTGEPLYLTRGQYHSAWYGGKGEVLAWNPDWT